MSLFVYSLLKAESITILELLSKYDVPLTCGQRVSEILKNDLNFFFCRTQQITNEHFGNVKNSSPLNEHQKKKNIAPFKEIEKQKYLPCKRRYLTPYNGRYVKRLQELKGFSSEPPPYRHSQDSRPTDTTSPKYPSRRHL